MATDIEPTSNQTGRSKAKDEIAKDIHVEQAETKRVPRPEGVNAKSPILWSYLIPVLVFHLMIPLAVYPFFSWWGLLFLPIGNYFFTSMGIGAGYHRLLTHKGFDCPKWLEYTLCLLYTSPSPRDKRQSRMPSSA